MADTVVVLGLFQDLDPTVEALDRLRELGIADDDITIVSGMPYSSEALGRPHLRSRVPTIALCGAIAGALLGLFLTVATPHLYVVRVGGQEIVPGPPTAVLMYESIMLCLILGTFLGMLWLNWPKHAETQYSDVAITDDKIGVLLHCRPEQEEPARAILRSQGAESVDSPGRRSS